MKVFKAILFAFVSIVIINASANEPEKECVPQSEMQAISQVFTQFSELSKAPFCNDGSANWQLLSSLMFMRKTQFSANMPQSKDELFSGKFAKDWYGYFAARLNRLEAAPECAKGIIAFVRPGIKTMHICPMTFTDRYSSVDRATVMMHEARHQDGFPHMTCTRGARKDVHKACDVNIADGGSYAVTTETYAQFAKYAEGVHPAIKTYSRSAAIIYADEAFENPVRINRSERLLALTKDGKFFSVDTQTGESKQLGNADAIGRIIRRGPHLVIFPEDKTKKAEYIFADGEGKIEQSPSDFVSEYNAQTPEQKSALVDYHIGGQWTAKVYKNSLTMVCDTRGPDISEIQIPDGKEAIGLSYPEGYARESFKIQLLTATGDVFDVNCENKKASVSLAATRLDQRYTRIYKANGVVVGLLDGKLHKLDGERSAPIVTAIDGMISEIVPQQSFEFFNQ
ncbi:MAG: hypothetical protein K0R29_1782 [Pseudobdellovibrio sp.]|jgi:hypothetical protein|nr:hypothetical protein [Pseudobdellovibrio sp.]